MNLPRVELRTCYVWDNRDSHYTTGATIDAHHWKKGPTSTVSSSTGHFDDDKLRCMQLVVWRSTVILLLGSLGCFIFQEFLIFESRIEIGLRFDVKKLNPK